MEADKSWGLIFHNTGRVSGQRGTQISHLTTATPGLVEQQIIASQAYFLSPSQTVLQLLLFTLSLSGDMLLWIPKLNRL